MLTWMLACFLNLDQSCLSCTILVLATLRVLDALVARPASKQQKLTHDIKFVPRKHHGCRECTGIQKSSSFGAFEVELDTMCRTVLQIVKPPNTNIAELMHNLIIDGMIEVANIMH